MGILVLSLIKNCKAIEKTILSILHIPRYCVRIATQYWLIMTLARTGTSELTKEEWNELIALKEAINYCPHTVTPEKMELFTELMVRSLEGKGDMPLKKVS